MDKRDILAVVCSIIVVAVAAFAIATNGKDKRDPTVKEPKRSWTCHGNEHGHALLTTTIEIEGHKYVLLDGYRFGSISHAASCPCMDKK